MRHEGAKLREQQPARGGQCSADAATHETGRICSAAGVPEAEDVAELFDLAQRARVLVGSHVRTTSDVRPDPGTSHSEASARGGGPDGSNSTRSPAFTSGTFDHSNGAKNVRPSSSTIIVSSRWFTVVKNWSKVSKTWQDAYDHSHA